MTMTAKTPVSAAPATDRFVNRHNGPAAGDVAEMLKVIGYPTLDAFIDAVVPPDIRLKRPLDLPAARSEREALNDLRQIAAKNQIFRSYIGMGFHHTVTPPVIRRNILENPGWYTA